MPVFTSQSDPPEKGGATPSLLVKYQDRLRRLAQQMLQRHDRLRRMVDSEDLVQEASLRLMKVLAGRQSASSDEFCRIANVQVCRALADLARKLYGPLGYGRNTIPSADLPSEAGGALGVAIDKGATPSSIAGDADIWELLYREAANLPEDEWLVFDLLWLNASDRMKSPSVCEYPTEPSASGGTT